MLRTGTKPTVLHQTDLSYHGSFRGFGAVSKPTIAPFTVDIGKTMWDQNLADPPAFNNALPMGCTGMTQADNLSDSYGYICRPEYTYDWTCYMEGHAPNRGCDIRTSLKSTQVYGVQFLGESTDQEAEQHRGGKYFNIYDDGGLDWFDGITTAIYEQKVGASLGSPWFPSWSYIGSDGILPMPTRYELAKAKDDPNSLPWHNYSGKGIDQIGNDQFIQIKSWQGKQYGFNGWGRMPRDVSNVVFGLRGSAAFIQPKYTPVDLYTIKLAILEYEVRYLLRAFGYLLN